MLIVMMEASVLTLGKSDTWPRLAHGGPVVGTTSGRNQSVGGPIGAQPSAPSAPSLLPPTKLEVIATCLEKARSWAGARSIPARADVLDADALEVSERLEEGVLGVVPGVVVGERDDVHVGPGEGVGAGRRTREHQAVLRMDGLTALLAELALLVDEAHVGALEPRRQGADHVARRVLEERVAERATEADVSAGEEDDLLRRHRWRVLGLDRCGHGPRFIDVAK